MKQTVIPIKNGEVILFSEQIVLVKHTVDHKITLMDVKEQIEAAVKISGDKDFVAILDGALMLDIEEEAMTYAARYKYKRWKAMALIVRSISERLFANYYLQFRKPARPTKAFTTPAGAEKWLKQFVKIDTPLKYGVLRAITGILFFI